MEKFQLLDLNQRHDFLSQFHHVKLFSTSHQHETGEQDPNARSDNMATHEQRLQFLKEFQLFDPWKYPSSTFLLNHHLDTSSFDLNNDSTTNGSSSSSASSFDRLSSDELRLQQSLQEYQSEIDKLVASHRQPLNSSGISEYDAKNLHVEDLSPVIDRLQNAYMEMMYWDEALQLERCKCRLWFKEGTDEYTDSIHAQGKLYLRQEDFRQSKQLYEYARNYFATHTEPTTQRRQQHGHVLISLAGWHFFRQELDDAIKLLEEAEPLLDTNPALLVKCLDNQGLVHRLWGDFEMSLDKYQQALQVVTGGVDPETERALRLHVADMLHALERSDEALTAYQALLQSSNNNNGSERKSTFSGRRGTGLNKTGDDSSDDPDLGMKGVLLHNIATIHVDQGEYDMAMGEFQQALEYKQASAAGEHNPEVGKTLTSLGALYAGVFNDKVEALQCFNQALLIARINADGDPQSDPDVLVALQNISMLEQALQDEPK
jgi:tetratricopeptide (TPR) repeat protein